MKPSRALSELAIDDVSPGDVLGADVLDARGAVLLPAGSSLTEHVLDRLRGRNIDTLVIVLPESAEAEAARYAAMYERLEHLFRKVSDDPAAGRLKQAILQLRCAGPA